MSRPRGRWLPAALGIALLLGLLALTLVGRVLEPQRLTPLLLGQAGRALGLEFSVREPGEFAFRPAPSLVLTGLRVDRPGQRQPLLETERMILSLPWRTLRGGTLEITRLELEQPRLDLAQLQAWLAQRPSSDAEPVIPGFTEGARVADGVIVAEGWSIEGLSISLAALAEGLPTTLEASGLLQLPDRRLPFDLRADATPRARPAGLALDIAGATLDLRDGEATAATSIQARLSGQVWQHQGDIELHLPRLVLDAKGPDPRFDFSLHLPLHLQWQRARMQLVPTRFELAGGDVVPTTAGELGMTLGDTLSLSVDADIQTLPPAWPGIDALLGENPAPVRVQLRYSGRPGLQDPMQLGLEGHGASAELELSARELLEWDVATSLLPPATGEVRIDRLQTGGARLQGVRIGIERDSATPGSDVVEPSDGP